MHISVDILKSHWIVHFKGVNCKICKLYLSKAIEEKVSRLERKELIPSSVPSTFLPLRPPRGNCHLYMPVLHMLIPAFLYMHRKHRYVYLHLSLSLFFFFFFFLDKIQITLCRSASAVVFNLTMYPRHNSKAAHVKLFHYL